MKAATIEMIERHNGLATAETATPAVRNNRSSTQARQLERITGKVWPKFVMPLAATLLFVLTLRMSPRWTITGVVRRLLAPLGLYSWVYLIFISRWHARWGATDDETQKSLPGDDIVQDPWVESTRSITIGATPEAIWPWLVQMGYKRGGWYSYDLLDNGGVPSADHIVPELQHLEIGDTVPYMPGQAFKVVGKRPNRALVLLFDTDVWLFRWAFVLEPLDEQSTRLLIRARSTTPQGPASCRR